MAVSMELCGAVRWRSVVAVAETEESPGAGLLVWSFTGVAEEEECRRAWVAEIEEPQG